MSDQPKPDRVWIEIEKPDPTLSTEEQLKIGGERAVKFSKLLAKLGYKYQNRETIFWWQEKRTYCVTIDEAGGYQPMGDNGHWFNLDYCSREGE